MFAIDRRVLVKLEPVVRRVLVVDPNMHSAKLLAEILKGMGAREVAIEGEDTLAHQTLRGLEPGLIFTEFTGPELDGPAFARAIRRSSLGCRRAPIIMVSGEATAASILAARDAGVHEFLRKPFTSADLFKRVENVATRPRDWVEGVAYVGPDRRRFNSGEYGGPKKRRADSASSPEDVLLDAKDQCMRILAAALDQFRNDPVQATRAVREQSARLKDIALKTGDQQLAVGVGALEVTLASGLPSRGSLTAPIQALLALHPIDDMRRAG